MIAFILVGILIISLVIIFYFFSNNSGSLKNAESYNCLDSESCLSQYSLDCSPAHATFWIDGDVVKLFTEIRGLEKDNCIIYYQVKEVERSIFDFLIGQDALCSFPESQRNNMEPNPNYCEGSFIDEVFK